MARRKSFAGVSFFSFQDIVTSVLGIFMLVMMILVVEFIQKRSEAKPSQTHSVDAELTSSLESLQQQKQDIERSINELQDDPSSSSTLNSFQIEELSKDIRAELTMNSAQIKATNEHIEAVSKALFELQQEEKSMATISASKEPERNELKRIDEQLAKLRSIAQKFQNEDSMVFRQSQTSGKSIIIVDLKPLEAEVLRMTIGQREKVAVRGKRDFIDWLRNQDVRSSHYLFFVRPGAASSFSGIKEFVEQEGYSFGYDAVPADLKLQMFEEIEKG